MTAASTPYPAQFLAKQTACTFAASPNSVNNARRFIAAAEDVMAPGLPEP